MKCELRPSLIETRWNKWPCCLYHKLCVLGSPTAQMWPLHRAQKKTNTTPWRQPVLSDTDGKGTASVIFSKTTGICCHVHDENPHPSPCLGVEKNQSATENHPSISIDRDHCLTTHSFTDAQNHFCRDPSILQSMDWFVGTSDQHGPTPWDTLGFPAPGIYILTNSLVGDGWWLTYPSEKYDSQLGWLSHILWKIKKMFQTTNQILSISHRRYSQFWVDCPSCTRRRLLPLPSLDCGTATLKWHK